MKKDNFEKWYETPLTMNLEVFSEGVLSASFSNENFSDNGTSYGSGSENNGWIIH